MKMKASAVKMRTPRSLVKKRTKSKRQSNATFFGAVQGTSKNLGGVLKSILPSLNTQGQQLPGVSKCFKKLPNKNLITSTPHHTRAHAADFFRSHNSLSGCFSPIDQTPEDGEITKYNSIDKDNRNHNSNNSIELRSSRKKGTSFSDSPNKSSSVVYVGTEEPVKNKNVSLRSDKLDKTNLPDTNRSLRSKEKASSPVCSPKKTRIPIRTASQDKEKTRHHTPSPGRRNHSLRSQDRSKSRDHTPNRLHQSGQSGGVTPQTTHSKSQADQNNLKLNSPNVSIRKSPRSKRKTTESTPHISNTNVCELIVPIVRYDLTEPADRTEFVNKTPRRRKSRVSFADNVKSGPDIEPQTVEPCSVPKKDTSQGPALQAFSPIDTRSTTVRCDKDNKNLTHTPLRRDLTFNEPSAENPTTINNMSKEFTANQLGLMPTEHLSKRSFKATKEVDEQIKHKKSEPNSAENKSSVEPRTSFLDILEEIKARKVVKDKVADENSTTCNAVTTEIGVNTSQNSQSPNSRKNVPKKASKSKETEMIYVANSDKNQSTSLHELMEEIIARKIEKQKRSQISNCESAVSILEDTPNAKNAETAKNNTPSTSTVEILDKENPQSRSMIEELTTKWNSRGKNPRHATNDTTIQNPFDIHEEDDPNIKITLADIVTPAEVQKRMKKWETILEYHEKCAAEIGNDEDDILGDEDDSFNPDTDMKSGDTEPSIFMASKAERQLLTKLIRPESRRNFLHTLISKLSKNKPKSSKRTRKTISKEIQTSVIHNISNIADKSQSAPLFRRRSILKGKKKRESRKGIYESDTSNDVNYNNPNIYDSVAEGNQLDALNFTADEGPELSSPFLAERPWRFEDTDASHEREDNIPLKFIRTESEIRYQQEELAARSIRLNSTQKGKTRKTLQLENDGQNQSLDLVDHLPQMQEIRRSSPKSQAKPSKKNIKRNKKFKESDEQPMSTDPLDSVSQQIDVSVRQRHSINVSQNRIPKARISRRNGLRQYIKSNRKYMGNEEVSTVQANKSSQDTSITDNNLSTRASTSINENTNDKDSSITADNTINKLTKQKMDKKDGEENQTLAEISPNNHHETPVENTSPQLEHLPSSIFTQNDESRTNTEKSLTRSGRVHRRLEFSSKKKQDTENVDIVTNIEVASELPTIVDTPKKSNASKEKGKRNTTRNTRVYFGDVTENNIIQNEDGKRPQRTRKRARYLTDVDIEARGYTLLPTKRHRKVDTSTTEKGKKRQKSKSNKIESNIPEIVDTNPSEVLSNINDKPRMDNSESHVEHTQYEQVPEKSSEISRKENKETSKKTSRTRNKKVKNNESNDLNHNHQEISELNIVNDGADSSERLSQIAESRIYEAPLSSNNIIVTVVPEEGSVENRNASPMDSSKRNGVTKELSTYSSPPPVNCTADSEIMPPPQDILSDRLRVRRDLTNDFVKPKSKKKRRIRLNPPKRQTRKSEKRTKASTDNDSGNGESDSACSGSEHQPERFSPVEPECLLDSAIHRKGPNPDPVSVSGSLATMDSNVGDSWVHQQIDEDRVRCIVDGEEVYIRIISRRPDDDAFVPLSNIHVFETTRDHEAGFSAGYLRLDPGEQKRPTTGYKYAFEFQIISGSAHVQAGQFEGICHPGDLFYVPIGMSYSIKNASDQNKLYMSYTRINKRK